jgi:hypothetical protein
MGYRKGKGKGKAKRKQEWGKIKKKRKKKRKRRERLREVLFVTSLAVCRRPGEEFVHVLVSLKKLLIPASEPHVPPGSAFAALRHVLKHHKRNEEPSGSTCGLAHLLCFQDHERAKRVLL